MCIQVTLTPEEIDGVCTSCGKAGAVYRFFIEMQAGSGDTEAKCAQCLLQRKNAAELSPPMPAVHKPPSKRLRKLIQKEERKTAAMVGGYAQKASGATPSAKGDIRVRGKLRGEEKSTTLQSFSIKRYVLDKIRSECAGSERPFVLIRFRNAASLSTEDCWVLIPVEDWEHANAKTTGD